MQTVFCIITETTNVTNLRITARLCTQLVVQDTTTYSSCFKSAAWTATPITFDRTTPLHTSSVNALNALKEVRTDSEQTSYNYRKRRAPCHSAPCIET